MPFDPFAQGLATEEKETFDPFAQGLATPPGPEPAFDPFSEGLASEDPDSIKQRLFAPGSTAIPTQEEARILWEAQERDKSPGNSMRAAAKGFVQAVPQVFGMIGDAVQQGWTQATQNAQAQDPSAAYIGSQANPLVQSAIPTVLEAAARGTYDIANLGRKAWNVTRDHVTGDTAEKYYLRLLEDLEVNRQRDRVVAGEENLLPQGFSVNQGAAEIGSYALDPTAVVPAAWPAKSVATAAGRGLLSNVVEQVAKGTEKAAVATADIARKPQQILAAMQPGTSAGLGLVAGVTGAGPALLKTAAAVKGTEKAAQGVAKASEFIKELSRTSGTSQFSRLEQLAMSEAVPTWVRGAARNLGRTGVDKIAATASNIAETGAKGAGVGAALALPGAENSEELGAAAGSGFALGSLAHVALAPFSSPAQKRLAEDADLFRWHEAKPPEQQAAIGKLDRASALKAMESEHLANGLRQDAGLPNVEFSYLPEPAYNAATGSRGTRAAAFQNGPTPRILINVDKVQPRTFSHEVFHVLQNAPDAVNFGELSRQLFDLTDEKGNVVRKGLLSEEDLKARGEQYISRFAPEDQTRFRESQEIFKQNPQDPRGQEWRDTVMQELAAESFANMAEGTGNVIKNARSPVQRMIDAAITQNRIPLLKDAAKKLDARRNESPESDIFPGFKATPEINALLRDFVRRRGRMTERLEFEDGAGKTPYVEARDFRGPDGPKLAEIFKDNDMLKKGPDGTVLKDPSGKPVLLDPAQVNALQRKRTDLLTKALSVTPDAGEPGAMRPVNGGFEGTRFTDAQLAEIEKIPNDILAPSLKAKLRFLNDTMKQGDGSLVQLNYNAATKEGKSRKDGKRAARKYSSLISATDRLVAPWHMRLTKAANLTVTGIDVTKFQQKFVRWQREKPKAFEDFDSPQHFLDSARKALENHQKGLPARTDLHADPVKAKRMADAINDFLNITDKASLENNPRRLSSQSDKDILIRTFRFDRINAANSAEGKFPVSHPLQKANFSPSGTKLYHGSPTKELDTLRAGSMMTTDPAWAAGYTTRFRPDFENNREVEEFAGVVYEASPFQPQNPVFATSLHGAEDRLLRLAEMTGEQTSTLQQAARAVNRQFGYDAIVAIRGGETVGVIPLVDVPVSKTHDPLDQVRQAEQAGKTVATNLRDILKRAAPSFSPDTASSKIDLRKYDAENFEFAVSRAIWDGKLTGWQDPKIESLYKEWNGRTAPGAAAQQKPQASFSPDIDSKKEQAKNSPTPVDPFFSQLKKTVASKFTGQSMPSAQLAAILRNPQNGIKAEEMKWSGMDDFLKEHGGRVTREEVDSFLAGNELKIEEVEKGAKSIEDLRKVVSVWRSRAFRRIRGLVNDGAEQSRIIDSITHRTDSHEAELSKLQAADPGFEWDQLGKAQENLERRSADTGASDTKFSQYQIPGGENYREILFRVPEKAPAEVDTSGWKVLTENGSPGNRTIRVVDKSGNVIESRSGFRGTDGEALLDAAVNRQRSLTESRRQRTSYKSGHWDEPNVLAHTRINERTDGDGKRMLFTEEIQSDWHQKGRKDGYLVEDARYKFADFERAMLKKYEVRYRDDLAERLTPEELDRFIELQDAAKGEKNKVPDAPFKNTWHEFAFKRLLRMAAEGGFDRLGWTTGETQAARYDLSKQVDEVHYYPESGRLMATKDGLAAVDKRDVKPEQLDDIIGKEVAKRLLETPTRKGIKDEPYHGLSGEGLKVGGEGMKGFYDKMLPAFAKKYGKKWGAEVKQVSVGEEKAWAIEITPQMKKSVLSEGQPLFSPDAEPKKSSEIKRLKAQGLSTPMIARRLGMKASEVTEVLKKGVDNSPKKSFSPDVTAKQAREKLVPVIEERIASVKKDRFDKIEVFERDKDDTDEPDIWIVNHPDARDSWSVYQEGDKWRAERDGSFTQLQTTREAAIEDAKNKLREEVGETRGTYGSEFDNQAEIGELFGHFDVPKGAKLVDSWIGSKWGSYYARVKLPDGTVLKLAVKDHSAVREGMDKPDMRTMVSKDWTPEEVSRALSQLEEKLATRVEQIQD